MALKSTRATQILEWVPDAMRGEVAHLMGKQTLVDFPAFERACKVLIQRASGSGSGGDPASASAADESPPEAKDPDENSPKTKHGTSEVSVDARNIRKLFDRLDVRGVGVLRAQDLRPALPGASLQDIEALMAKAGASNQGLLTFEEFLAGFDAFVEAQPPGDSETSGFHTHSGTRHRALRHTHRRSSNSAQKKWRKLKNTVKAVGALRQESSNESLPVLDHTAGEGDGSIGVFARVVEEAEHAQRLSTLSLSGDESKRSIAFILEDEPGGGGSSTPSQSRRGSMNSTMGSLEHGDDRMGGPKLQGDHVSQHGNITNTGPAMGPQTPTRGIPGGSPGGRRTSVVASGDDEMASLRAKYESVRDHLGRVNRKYKLLGRLGQRLEVENAKLNRQLTHAVAELDVRSNDVDELTEALESLRAQNEKTLERTEELRDRNLELSREHAAAVEALENAQRANQRLTDESARQRDIVQHLSSAKAKETRASRVTKMAQTRFLREAMKEKRNSQLQALELLRERKHRDELSQEIARLGAESERKDALLESLQQQLKEERERVNSSSLALDMLRPSIRSHAATQMLSLVPPTRGRGESMEAIGSPQSAPRGPKGWKACLEAALTAARELQKESERFACAALARKIVDMLQDRKESGPKTGSKAPPTSLDAEAKTGVGGQHGLIPRPMVPLTESGQVQVRVLTEYINSVLGDNKSLQGANIVPVDPGSADLIHKVGDGMLLAALINHGAPDTIDARALNTRHYHDPRFHPFLHESQARVTGGAPVLETRLKMATETSARSRDPSRSRDLSRSPHPPQSEDDQGAAARYTRETLDVYEMIENLTLVTESAKSIGVQLARLRTKHLLYSFQFPVLVLEFIWKILAAHSGMRASVTRCPSLVHIVSPNEPDWKLKFETARGYSPEALLSTWARHHVSSANVALRASKVWISGGQSGRGSSPESLSTLSKFTLRHALLIVLGIESERAAGKTQDIKASADWVFRVLQSDDEAKGWRQLQNRLRGVEFNAANAAIFLNPDLVKLARRDAEATATADKRKRGGKAHRASLWQTVCLVSLSLWLDSCPTLDSASAGRDHRSSSARKHISKVALMQDDDRGSSRLERAFRMWINSINAKGVYIHNLFTDCRDGLVLLRVLDKIVPGAVPWRRVEKKPNNKFQKLSNCNLVVTIAKGPSFLFSLVSVAGADLVSGNKKLTLALVWQMMRYHLCDFLQTIFDRKFHASKDHDDSKGAQGGGRPSRLLRARSKRVLDGGDAAIIAWANHTISQAIAREGKPPLPAGSDCERHAQMRGFRDEHLRAGLYFLVLLWAVDPYPVDWSIATPGETQEDRLLNARYAISVARKLGATIFLLPEDILELNGKMLLTFIGAVVALKS